MPNCRGWTCPARSRFRVRAALPRRPQHELGRLGAGEEAERDERSPGSPGDDERRPLEPEDALGIPRAKLAEAHLAARVGKADLPTVNVPCQHEVERAGMKPVDDLGEVAEDEAKVRVRVGELLEPGSPCEV